MISFVLEKSLGIEAEKFMPMQPGDVPLGHAFARAVNLSAKTDIEVGVAVLWIGTRLFN